MKLKKFKNGVINMKLEKSDKFYYNSNYNSLSYDETIKKNIDIIDIDMIYNDVLSMNDLSFNQINGYMYLIDFNTNNIYDFSNCYINILMYLKNVLIDFYNKNQTLKLYPVSKKEYKELIKDMEGGF